VIPPSPATGDGHASPGRAHGGNEGGRREGLWRGAGSGGSVSLPVTAQGRCERELREGDTLANRGGPRILSMGIQNYNNILMYEIKFIKN
jgi:hypothetical protein